MKRFTLVVLALVAALVLAACSVEVDPGDPNNPDDPGDPNTPTQVEGNNAAVLTGATLGSGAADVAALRKDISVRLITEDRDLELRDAYLARESADTETFEWFVELVNTGTETYCFVQALGLEFSGDGESVLIGDNSFVQGNVRVGANDVYTDTCLAGGQTGYFFSIENAADGDQLYSLIDSLTLSELTVQAGGEVPPASIVPQEYSVAPGTPQEIAVNITNTGTALARLEEFSNYILLDDDEQPLTWNFFNSPSNSVGGDGTVAAGETRVLNDTLSYDGSADRMLAYTDFEDPNSTLNAPDLRSLAGLSGAAAKVRFVELRNAQIGRELALSLESSGR